MTTTHKFIIAVNKTLEPGVAMNSVAHTALGLSGSATEEQREQMMFMDFADKGDQNHPSISGLSLIIMRGKNGELRKFRLAAKEAGLHVVDFIQTMTGDTYVEQLEKTKNTTPEEIIYYSVGVFGEKEKIDPLTRKLSLWR